MKIVPLLPIFLLPFFLTAVQAEEIKNELYTVVDGTKVDRNTLTGFRTWRAAACDRCHGANQEGMVGPSLLESLKKLSREDFILVVTEGRLEKGMPTFKENKQVTDNIEQLYRYLKGRSNGDIVRAKVEGIE